MDRVRESDSRESLTIPANRILAIIMDSDEAPDIVENLNRNGFSPGEIDVLAGIEDASGRKGLFAKLVASEIDLRDRDTAYIKQYRRAALNGRTVIAVTVKKDEARKKAVQILKAFGARFITFFGQSVTELVEV
jgi:hypothetical protein